MENFLQQKQLSGELPFACVNQVELVQEMDTECPMRVELNQIKTKLVKTQSQLKTAKEDRANTKLHLELRNKYVTHLEIKERAHDSEMADLETKIQNLQKQLDEANFWKDKITKSSDRQDGIIDELNENLLRHIETIQHLEKRLTPEVNNVYHRGGRGRGNPRYKQNTRKPKQCVDKCGNYVERCERCGKSTDNNYCDICKIPALNCTMCMYDNAIE